MATNYESAVTAIVMGEYAMKILRSWDDSLACLAREKQVVGLNRVHEYSMIAMSVFFHPMHLGSMPVVDKLQPIPSVWVYRINVNGIIRSQRYFPENFPAFTLDSLHERFARDQLCARAYPLDRARGSQQ